MPDSPEQIREVPGIGPYTAGAVLSIAYGLKEPLVDGNVARVLSRLFLLKGDYRKMAEGQTIAEHYGKKASLYREVTAPDGTKTKVAPTVEAVALPGNRQAKNLFERFGLVARAIIVQRRLTDGT